jgi:hypothetical protein
MNRKQCCKNTNINYPHISEFRPLNVTAAIQHINFIGAKMVIVEVVPVCLIKHHVTDMWSNRGKAQLILKFGGR